MYSADGNLQGILKMQTNSKKSQQEVFTLATLLMRLPSPLIDTLGSIEKMDWC